MKRLDLSVVKGGFLLSVIILLGGIMNAQQQGGTLTVALGYDLDTLDPYASGFLTDVQATFMAGLVAPNENAEYVPVLAEEVPTVENGGIVLTDDNKMVVTYRLRPDLKWADGEPLTSADIVFTWEAIKDPNYLGPEKSGTEEIDRIETPDELTAVVYYNTVFVGFKASLFTYGLLPKHVLEGKDLNSDPFWDKPFGAGPFMVSEFRRGEYVVVERNPNYFEVDENGVQLPYLDQIIFKIIPDTNTQVTQLKTGEVTFAYNLPYTLVPSLEGTQGLEIIAAKTLAFRHVTFNIANPLLADVNVRKAFAHGIDREAINKALGGFMTPTNTFVVSTFPFKSEDVPTYPYDPEIAKQLLADAGYTPGGDGILEKDGQRLSFRFMTQAGRTEYELSQQVVIAQMKALGIELIPDNKSGAAYSEARRSGDFDVWYSGWITPADPIDSYQSFYATGGFNNGGAYGNPELDAIFESANATLDMEEITGYMQEAQTIVLTDLPAIPLLEAPSMIAVTSQLQGFTPNPTNQTNFRLPARWWLEQ
jgi:peptide/nickel transport system substrate-binding protein